MKRLTVDEGIYTIVRWFWAEDKKLLISILTLSSLIYGIGFFVVYFLGFKSIATLALLNTSHNEIITGSLFVLHSVMANITLSNDKLEKIYSAVINYTGSFIWVASAIAVINGMFSVDRFEPILLFFIFPILSSLVLSVRSFFELFEK